MFQVNLGLAREHPGRPVAISFREQLPGLDGPDGTLDFPDPVEVEVSITYVEGLYWLDGLVRGRVALACARCLERFLFPFEVAIAEKYRIGQTAGDGGATIVPGDLVDFSGQVEESIMLALPMKALCRTECQGLCPECGQVLNETACDCRLENVDPRFAVLEKLLKENPKGVE